MSFDSNRTVVITGGAGFLGARVAGLLLDRYPGIRLRLTDLTETPRLASLRDSVEFVLADLSDREQVEETLGDDVGTVFHLASLVSGGAERDFEAGLKANLYATVNVLEVCRRNASSPCVVFTSSIATFGGSDLPEQVDDRTFQHPQNSYGVAKVIGEQLINDYSRKGFVSGRGVRLPAVIVRDVANTAASGYASTMIREALAGRDYDCPVSEGTRIPVMGASTATALLVRLAALSDGALGDYRTVNGHGLSPTAGEIAEAVGRVAAAASIPVGRIRFEPQVEVERIVATWPKVMRADLADSLGLPANESIDEIVQSYLHTVSDGLGQT